MKDRQIILPKLERREKELTVADRIKKALGNKCLTSWQITLKITGKPGRSGNIRCELAMMVRRGDLEVLKCPHCDVGSMYQVKK